MAGDGQHRRNPRPLTGESPAWDWLELVEEHLIGRGTGRAGDPRGWREYEDPDVALAAGASEDELLGAAARVAGLPVFSVGVSDADAGPRRARSPGGAVLA